MTVDASAFYITGGTLPRDAVSYIERDTDGALYNALLQGEFCYILTSRQMGKSSLMVRTAARLRARSIRIVAIDLTAIGIELTLEQWYNGLLTRIGRQLDLEDELEDFWRASAKLPPLERWLTALEKVLLPDSPEPIVIFLDEIDVVRSLPFATDEFFAAIRSCYNRRDQEPDYKRLTFCLLGVVSPSELIQDVRMTPFNIGQRIELRDFTAQEAGALAVGIQITGRRGAELLKRVLYWTNGHPYLTQRLCAAVAEDPNVLRPNNVDPLCERLFFQSDARIDESNLSFVSNSLLKSEEDIAGLLDLYQRVSSRWGRVANNPASSLCNVLRLSGIVSVSGGYLQVRNRIYQKVFDRQWMRTNMPDAELKRQKAAYRRGMVRTISLSGTIALITSILAIYAFQQRDHARLLASSYAHTIYIDNIQRIPPAWANNDVDAVSELLGDAWIPLETSDYDIQGMFHKERAFEWGYWNRLCHLDLLTLGGPPPGICAIPNASRPRINSVAVSPSGKYIVTSSEKSAVAQVWDVTMRRVILTLEGHGGPINCVKFSTDGNRIATASADNTARVWDSKTGHEIFTLKGHRNIVTSVAFSADGKQIITGSSDATARLWDAATGKWIRSLAGHTNVVQSVAFSPDGKRIVSGSDDNTAKIWDTATGHQLRSLEGHTDSFKGHTDGIAAVAFSPDGKQIVTGSSDTTARIWDANTGREIRKLSGHTVDIQSVAYSPDGLHIVTGSWDKTAKVWDARTGHELFTLKGHTNLVASVAFSPDGKQIITGSFDGSVKVWDAQRDRAFLTYNKHLNSVMAVAFSPDGKRIVTGGLDKIVMVWNAATGQVLFPLVGHSNAIRSVAFSSDGKWIVTGGYDNTARVWDADTGHPVRTLKGHTQAIRSVAFSTDGTRIVTGSYDNTAKIWDAKSGHELFTLRGHTDHVTSVAFSPDGRRIVTGSNDTTARVWDVATGHEALPPLQGQQPDIYAPDYSAVNSVAFSPDGKWIVTGGYDNTARIWDADTGHPVRTLKGHTQAISSVAFSGDSKRLVTGSVDKTAKVWDVQTGKDLLTLTGHTNWIISVAFSVDGKRIVTAGNDHRAIVYYAE